MDRLKQVIEEKNKEFKRLKNSFETLKSQNDDVKIQVAHFSVFLFHYEHECVTSHELP